MLIPVRHLSALCLVLGLGSRDRVDLLIADFEGRDYGGWVSTGEAFGPGPAQGTLAGQMVVSGYRGHGLVNSFFHGDGATGTLTSPQFTVERRYINFLVGGGVHPGRTCINLLVEGNVARTTTGTNSERLDRATWDVHELAGKTARIEIVDRETGGWGHISVDDITQSDRKMAEEIKTAPLYQETYRPKYHFTAQKGWLNDPNGCVFYGGEFHLFFQHNPKGTEWGNMTWGHAVSSDLVHWKQLPNAIEPDRLGTIFSGSAVIDGQNTTGFGHGGEKPLVCIYTAAGGTSGESKGQLFTQCIAYSLDRGRTFKKYEGNPVLPHIAGENRDPKVIWHAPTKKWIMALYLTGNDYALFSSPDLKKWTELQRITMPDCSECPDFFPMKVDGESGTEKWIFTAANGRYLVGDFDGTKFTFEGKPQQVEYGANCYAVQTYSGWREGDKPVQMAWMNGGSYPQMPFNQQMAFPCVLSLHRVDGGFRMRKQPSSMIANVRTGRYSTVRSDGLTESTDHTPDWPVGDAFEVILDAEVGSAREIELQIFGEPVTYSVPDAQLKALGRTAPLKPEGGKIKLQILVDRTSMEIFANDGVVTLTSCVLPRHSAKPLELRAIGGKTGKVRLVAGAMKSVWPTAN